jgi:hypothetical protein
LASFRFRQRYFVQFNEWEAEAVGLQPQQHRLVLQLAGVPVEVAVVIIYAKERSRLKRNSAVELVNRSEREGLRARKANAVSNEQPILRLTCKGK